MAGTLEHDHTFWAPNPSGPLRDGFGEVADRRKLYVLDMFPYPSGEGLHVGHPLGYISSDVYPRFMRMTGYNVLRAMGYDSFGLPAEQYTVEHGRHPRVTVDANIATMRRRSVRSASGTTPGAVSPPPTSRTTAGHSGSSSSCSTRGSTTTRGGRGRSPSFSPSSSRARASPTATQTPTSRHGPTSRPPHGATVVDSYRLAYLDEAMVNWCPALGTVLANEEVTADGRSDRGNHPVFRRPLKQWKLRITAYADRLLADLDLLDWPESIKTMQRNWIGRSDGRDGLVPIEEHEGLAIEVFTTRPDTLFGATYMVLAPEHPLLDEIVPAEWPDATLVADLGDMPDSWKGIFGVDRLPSEAVAAYREFALPKSRSRCARHKAREKTGVFTGAYAINPDDRQNVPIWVADYVLMGYGTGAIMAVPAHDERDFEFAPSSSCRSSRWCARRCEWPTDSPPTSAEATSATVSRSTPAGLLDGLPTAEAKERITAWLEEPARRGAVNYKLRDWLFSRQRYWGEPFPIAARRGRTDAHRAGRVELPVELPEMADFKPQASADAPPPEPPLAAAPRTGSSPMDRRDGRGRTGRETEHHAAVGGLVLVLPALPRSTNDEPFCDPAVEHTGCADPAASISTSAAPSTPCCTCSMRASGTRCCSTCGHVTHAGAVPAAVSTRA